MTLVWREARREGVGIFVALAGGSSSGKTFSALRMASGIVAARGGGEIGVLDTEAGRTLHYADKFRFRCAELAPPFTPEQFAAAAEDAEKKQGFAVLIIDNFSSEWNAEGGVLDMQLADLDRRAGKDEKKRHRALSASWIEPKRRHKAMMNSFQQRRIPIIFVLRAEEKTKPGADGEKPVYLGWVPVGDKRLKFELTVMLTLHPDRPGRVDLSLPHKLEDQHARLFPPGELIGESAGAGLWAWANSQGAAAGRATPAATAAAAPAQAAPRPSEPPAEPAAAAAAPAPPPAQATDSDAETAAQAKRFAASVRRKIEQAENGEALRLLMELDRVRHGRDRLRESFPALDAEISQALAARTISFGPAAAAP